MTAIPPGSKTEVVCFVRGGCLVEVIAPGEIEYILVDWDEINAGEDIPALPNWAKEKLCRDDPDCARDLGLLPPLKAPKRQKIARTAARSKGGRRSGGKARKQP